MGIPSFLFTPWIHLHDVCAPQIHPFHSHRSHSAFPAGIPAHSLSPSLPLPTVTSAYATCCCPESFWSPAQNFSFYFSKPSMAPYCLQSKVQLLDPNFSLPSNSLQASYAQAKPNTNCSVFESWLIRFPLPAGLLHCTTPRGPFHQRQCHEHHWSWSVHGLHSYTCVPGHLDHIYHHTHFPSSK